MSHRTLIGWGQPVPWFNAPTPINRDFIFSSLGGRFVLLMFIGDSRLERAQQFMQNMAAFNFPFRDNHIVPFAVSRNGSDFENPHIASLFKKRVFHDPKCEIACKYNAAQKLENGDISFSGAWYLIDPTLRVYAAGALSETEKLYNILKQVPEAPQHVMPDIEPWAPVLVVPRVLSLDLCSRLIDLYKTGNPRPSGFMVEKEGKTTGIQNAKFKRRNDIQIEDPAICRQINNALYDRLVPEVHKAFQFKATRIERYIVACYTAEESGFFAPHRDNTTAGTAHRRFAVTINLNADDFEGGELRFPEFGPRSYKAPTGGAVVFSCSLLHEALPVTSGIRYATLPFLFDEAAAEIRANNMATLDGKMQVVT